MNLFFEIIKNIALYVMPISAFLLSVLAYIRLKDCTHIKIKKMYFMV